MALELEIFNLKVSYLLRKEISLLRPNLFVSKLIINCNSVNFQFSIFEIALQNANFNIVNFVIICIEMQWQRRSIFLSDRVCVIIKSVSENTASFSNI